MLSKILNVVWQKFQGLLSIFATIGLNCWMKDPSNRADNVWIIISHSEIASKGVSRSVFQLKWLGMKVKAIILLYNNPPNHFEIKCEIRYCVFCGQRTLGKVWFNVTSVMTDYRASIAQPYQKTINSIF